MIDNISLVLPLMSYDSEDDFYFLQILQRKKENPQLGSNSRVIKNYYIRSEEYLFEHYDEIKKLCDHFNARAMLRLNKRSYYKVAFRALLNVANTMSNKDFKNLKSQYDKACGETHNDKNKTWIIDIDEKEFDFEVLDKYLATIDPIGHKTVQIIPSANGYHAITKPFNVLTFSLKYKGYDIHKDNPTNLYIP